MRAMKPHRLCRCGLLVLLVALTTSAQSKPPPKADPDRLGRSCAQILAMTSSDWVGKFTQEKGATPDAMVRAIHAYGQCYDARTDRLAALLGKNGKGPLMGARGNFRDFEQSISEFATKALAATDTPADSVKTAYAALYRKQFRYIFDQSYEPKKASPTAAAATKSAAPASPPVATQPTAQSQEDAPVSEMTKAKNRFGELLDALPDENLREIHKAFGKIFSGGPVSDEMKLEVYRYAIFCLESPSAEPFSPPPF